MTHDGNMLTWEKGWQAPEDSLQATFIVTSRTLSDERIKQLIKRYLPKGNIIWGIALEDYVAGFDGQPQFKTLRQEDVWPWAELTNKHSAHKITIFTYPQHETESIARLLRARKYVFVRGSWQYSFHMQPLCGVLRGVDQPFSFVSPFSDESEARAFAERTAVLEFDNFDELNSKQEFLNATYGVAKASYDHSFQIGAILAKKGSFDEYAYKAHAHNEVVPYETYAMHNGFMREEQQVPPQDLNHYDTVHAETLLLMRNKDVQGLSLFVNVMPCRTCARAIVAAGISEVYYALPHAGDYVKRLFADSDIHLERVVQ